jgi:hypothetical protein
LVIRFILKYAADKLIFYQNTDTFFSEKKEKKIAVQYSLRDDPYSNLCFYFLHSAFSA